LAHHYDVLAIGNAIVDVISSETPDFLTSRGIDHGCMRLIDAAEAEALYAAMGPGREISGGSAANSVVGAAALGVRTAFVGRVAGDQLGQVFTHDIRAAGVAFDTAAATGCGSPDALASQLSAASGSAEGSNIGGGMAFGDLGLSDRVSSPPVINLRALAEVLPPNNGGDSAHAAANASASGGSSSEWRAPSAARSITAAVPTAHVVKMSVR
jgi:hypothetical protein